MSRHEREGISADVGTADGAVGVSGDEGYVADAGGVAVMIDLFPLVITLLIGIAAWVLKDIL